MRRMWRDVECLEPQAQSLRGVLLSGSSIAPCLLTGPPPQPSYIRYSVVKAPRAQMHPRSSTVDVTLDVVLYIGLLLLAGMMSIWPS